ncbi:family 16 glycosylhydrolase [Lapillicoccus sp.]|uniref:DUF7402 domain-containing protein n=1 Tax=Lapillicoccus sp. TaxID=1909287 RepID=UPI0025CD2B90|nr:family 16 glycosylhydrolase [Lapillicoccus sp.]
MSASSSRRGVSAQDVVTSGSVSDPGAGWRSDQQTAGAWLLLTWPSAHALHEVTLVRNPLVEPGLSSGYLTFGDRSVLSFPVSTTSRVTTVAFTPRSVTSLRFTVTAATPSARDVTVSELLVSDESDPDRDIAQPTSHDVGPAAARSSSTSDGSLGSKPGAWVEYTFRQPQEVASVQLVGGSGASARLTSGELSFSDGSSLFVGEVLGRAELPTTTGFMPRVVTSIRLTVTTTRGTGRVDLAEWRIYQAGATPGRDRPPVVAPDPIVVGGATTAPCAKAPAGLARLAVLCPTPGTAVSGRVSLRVATAASGALVSATAWSATAPATTVTSGGATSEADRVATLDLDVSAIPPGPFTVRLATIDPGGLPQRIDLVLYRPGSAPAAPAPDDVGARTLVYDEEFDAPLSVSRTGEGARYAAAKPTTDGVEDFGDAIFADPQGPEGTQDVVDHSYLRLATRATARPDPQGFGRRYVGALLSSARPGASGFSVQYGYFEARMAVSSTNGTWPAFWMLPADNLVRPRTVVPEIDAVELYGHDPTGACSSTHEREGGMDRGVTDCGRRFADDRSPTGWHTYAADVTPTGITFLLDGKVVATAPQVRGGDSPMFFLLDLALGGGWPIDLAPAGGGAVVYVDHVRVYV